MDIDELKQRFPRRSWQRGTRSKTFHLYARDTKQMQAVDIRAQRLSQLLGYSVTRTQVIEDLMARDPDIQQIEQEL